MSGAYGERKRLAVPDAGTERRMVVLLGNTTCRVALLQGRELRDELVLPHAALEDPGTAERLRDLAGPAAVAAVGLCSVVPSLEDALRVQFAAAGLPGPRPVRPAESAFFPTAYRSMETLGADRYCGVLAAHADYGAPAVVIDCGTATTVNVLDGAGVFRGGAIAPGIETALRALHDRTAQLPALRPAADTPLVGADTAESMRSGALHFTRHAVEGMAREIQKNMGVKTPIILTGGNGPLLRDAGLACAPLHVDTKLLFRGVLFHLLFTA